MSGLKTKTFRNVLYATLTKGIIVGCGAITTMVVARNLSARDYGVVGFAIIIIDFLLQFTDLGLARAAVRRSALSSESLDTVFTLKAVLGLSAFGVAWIIAPYARHFLDHPATPGVVRILAFDFLVTIVGFAPGILLTRELNYRSLVRPAAMGAVVQCTVAVILVLKGFSYWAVAVAEVTGLLAYSITVQLIKNVPLRVHLDFPDAREYLRFGMPLFGSGILIFVLLNIDNFLIGSRLGSVQLGYYDIAFTWSTFVCLLLNETVNNVLMPTFATMQNNTEAMRRWYLKTIGLVAFIAVIANSALFANAQFFLMTFLGKGTDKWLPAALSLKVLCVYGVIRAITVPIGICIMALGDTKTLLKANLVAGAAELLLLVIAIRAGRIEFVAAAVLIAYLTQAVVFLPFLRQKLSITTADLFAQVWPVIPAMTAGYCATLILPQTFGGTMWTLAARGMFTGATVALTHGVFSQFRCFHEARGLVLQKLGPVTN